MRIPSKTRILFPKYGGGGRGKTEVQTGHIPDGLNRGIPDAAPAYERSTAGPPAALSRFLDDAAGTGANCESAHLPSDFRNRQSPANLPCQQICNLGVARDRFRLSGFGVAPQGVRAAFALQIAAMQAQVAQQGFPLHWMVTVSRRASAGAPRNPSSRRSCRIS